jgi:hypothetical protein
VVLGVVRELLGVGMRIVIGGAVERLYQLLDV